MIESTPLVVERPVTSAERERKTLYHDALKAKRDTLLSFHTMTSFRKGKKPLDMPDDEIAQYNQLKEDWQAKKETSLGSWDNLPDDLQEELSNMGSRLYEVQAALTLLEATIEPTPVPAPEEIEPVVEPIEVTGGRWEEVEPGQEAIASSSAPIAETPKPDEFSAGVDKILEEKAVAPIPEIDPVKVRATELDEIDQKIIFAKGQILGLKGESLEDLQAQRAELLARQDAQANPERTAPVGFMARVRAGFASGFARARANTGQRSDLEEMPQPVSTQEAPVRMRVTGWSWLKERGRSFLPFGLGEFHQAEKFRSKTKEVANDVDALAKNIQQERNLSEDEAHEEANQMTAELRDRGFGLDVGGVGSAYFYEVYSDDITEYKRRENNQQIETVIKSAGDDLVEKLAKVRGEGGQTILSPENKLAFEADLRGELNKMRDGAFRKDFVKFAKIIRRNFDAKWWTRYIWGTAEAALSFAVVKFMVLKWEAIQAAKLAAAEAAAASGAEAGIIAAQESLLGHVQQSIWQDLANSGVSIEQLPDITTEVLQSNNISDKLLNIVKSGVDAWRLPPDFPVDYSSVMERLVELGADVSKLGVR